MTRKRFEHAGFSWLKLLIILLVISSMVGAVIIGYLSFTHQLPPIVGAVSFIVIVGLFIWFITMLRKSSMHYHTPSFILVFLSLVGITLVFAFAGVEPLASYKNNMVSTFATTARPSAQTTLPTSLPTITSPSSQSKVHGGWNYKLNNVIWDGNKVAMNIDVTNIGNEVLPFGGGLFPTDNKLCLVDSQNQIYWSKNDAEGFIPYFYNVKYYPNETKSGKLEFTVNSLSGECSLYLYGSSKPRAQLFLLGSPK